MSVTFLIWVYLSAMLLPQDVSTFRLELEGQGGTSLFFQRQYVSESRLKKAGMADQPMYVRPADKNVWNMRESLWGPLQAVFQIREQDKKTLSEEEDSNENNPGKSENNKTQEKTQEKERLVIMRSGRNEFRLAVDDYLQIPAGVNWGQVTTLPCQDIKECVTIERGEKYFVLRAPGLDAGYALIYWGASAAPRVPSIIEARKKKVEEHKEREAKTTPEKVPGSKKDEKQPVENPPETKKTEPVKPVKQIDDLKKIPDNKPEEKKTDPNNPAFDPKKP